MNQEAKAHHRRSYNGHVVAPCVGRLLKTTDSLTKGQNQTKTSKSRAKKAKKTTSGGDASWAQEVNKTASASTRSIIRDKECGDKLGQGGQCTPATCPHSWTLVFSPLTVKMLSKNCTAARNYQQGITFGATIAFHYFITYQT